MGHFERLLIEIWEGRTLHVLSIEDFIKYTQSMQHCMCGLGESGLLFAELTYIRMYKISPGFRPPWPWADP